jgi:hypothetical protein
LVAHDILATHRALSGLRRQVDGNAAFDGERQREAPKHGCRGVADDGAGDDCEGTNTFEQAVVGVGGGAYSVTRGD